MSRIESTVVIDRSIQDIWPFFTNVENVPAWEPGTREAKGTDGEFAPGTTVDEAARVGPIPLSFRQQVTELDPHRLIELRPVGGKGFTRVEFDGVGAATRLTVTSETHGLRGLLTNLLGLARPAKREEFFEDLKRLVEERTPRVADVAPPIVDTTPSELVEAQPAEEIAAQPPLPFAPAEAVEPARAEPSPVVPPPIEEDASAAAAPAAEEAPPAIPAASGEAVEPASGAPVAVGDRLVLRLESARGPAPAFEVTKTGATIGRGPDNTIRLDDLSVSRRHSRIAYRQGRFWLTDVGSTSGTWVDGTRLNAPRRLVSGLVIDVGLCRLRVELAAEEATAKDEEPAPSEIAGHGRRRH